MANKTVDVRFKDLINKTLLNVVVSKDQETVTFIYRDGTNKKYRVEGDCCSQSWIEHLEKPNDIQGAKILDVYDAEEITQNHKGHDEDHTNDLIQVYNTVFVTDKGEIILEYRNSSNGYYGGYLVED